MANGTLTANTPLDGYDRDFGIVRLRELGDLSIVSLAIPQSDEHACSTALNDAFGCGIPDNGRYCISGDGEHRIVRTQPDQLFVLFHEQAPTARAQVAAATGDVFFSTDQSDGWCALEISGAGAREALARVCPIDLDRGTFGNDAMARTVMEHMGAMILRTGDDSFLLLSARSSAKSFLHAVETSVVNVT